ncbi:Metal tolerance protein 8 [Hibiscus syriacus]|uniref:Metal tolerance protein 8 n=1 Tax=Hibiscus syriacus TaxID=106335 RepID=A0A6A3B3X0_HIBSY|nr:Metal tolerance protein 8 [Hibiscus syriacus]
MSDEFDFSNCDTAAMILAELSGNLAGRLFSKEKNPKKREGCVRIWPMLLPFLSGFLGCYEKVSMNWGSIRQLGGGYISIDNLGWPLVNIVVFGVILSENFNDDDYKLMSYKDFRREFAVTFVCTIILELFYFEEFSLSGLLCGLLLYVAVQEFDPVYTSFIELGMESSESLTMSIMKPIQHVLSERKSRKIALFLLINAGYMVVEFVAGFMSNSLGLISDACHMLFDCAALAIGLYASYFSRMPAKRASSCTWRIMLAFTSHPDSHPYDHHHHHSHDHGNHVEHHEFINVSDGCHDTCSSHEHHHSNQHHGNNYHGEDHKKHEFHGHHDHNHNQAAHDCAHHHYHHDHGYKHDHAHSHDHHDCVHRHDHLDHGHKLAHGHSHDLHDCSHHHDNDHHHHDQGLHSHSHYSEPKGHLPQKHQHRHIDHNMEGIFLHVLADTMGSVGVVVSTLLIKYKGWLVADPACSIFISVLIISSVIPLLRNSAEILLQRVPRAQDQGLKKATSEITNMKGVCSIQNLHVWSFTNSDTIGTVHLHIAAETDKAAMKSRVSQVFHDAGIKDLTLQVERVVQ